MSREINAFSPTHWKGFKQFIVDEILEEKAKLCEEKKKENFYPSGNHMAHHNYDQFNEGLEVAINIIRGTEK